VDATPLPALCFPEGPGLSKGEIGIPLDFKIFTRPEEGGGFPTSVKVFGPTHEPEATLSELESNVYAVNFVPKEQGDHNVVITISVTSQIRIPIGAWVPDPLQCIAYGPGLEAGEQFKPAEFIIEARNKLGDKIPIGGHDFRAKVLDPFGGELPVEVRDNGDGTYTATYVPFLPGDHVVTVTLEKDNIKDSPFHVNIDDSSETANAGQSYAEGPGLENNVNNTSQKTPATFTIFAIDKNGNPKSTGGDLFDVFVEDPLFDLLPVDIADNGDGTYTVQYNPHEPGVHHIQVVLRNKELPLDWEHIKNSPIDVVIKAGTDASHCIAEGPGLKDGILDTFPAEFTIFARDRDDQPITEGGDPFEVKVLDPEGNPCEVSIKDNGDGTYAVVYQPDGAGPHTVHVTLDDVPIKDCPKTIHVKPGAWPRNSYIEGFSLIIRTRDKRDKNIPEGGQDIKCIITDPHGNHVETLKLTDRGDGTYLIEYSLPPVEGKYLISCTVDNKEIRGSPFEQTVANI